ncbi:baseplate J/gp47 family protein, partial [Pseudomonas agarici]|uniref:baseplate J/gp47 family protein n=1 Tax=Pseudomonas agarici TaxID=46677 RepID=UPI00037E684F
KKADINTAFGGGVNPGLSTPQGQLAQSLTAIVGEKNDRIAEVVNLVDPDKSSGRWQDAIARIYFIDRNPAAGTVVTGTCTGLVGTVIPAGSLAQDVNGYLYASVADGTISATGTALIDFQCVTVGPIACPPGALSRVYQQVTGWDTITNVSVGTEGVLVESRADFEFRRKNSVAGNAVNSTQSVYAAVLAVDGVLDAYVFDNPKGVTVNTGSTNYPVVAHSIYVAVAGGNATDIAMAIWSKKPNGCDYNGTTSAVINDMNYSPPRPAYTVTWVTPTAAPIFFTVEIANNAALPSNIIQMVRDAIVAAFNGADGGQRARIASSIYAGRFYAGVSAANSNVQILAILLGTTSPGTATSVLMGIDQRPTLDPANINVTLV